MTVDDRGVARARQVIDTLALFAQSDRRALGVTRFGGTTNLVFRIDAGAEHYVLRVPGKGTEEYINRAHEAQAARETARVRVSPEVLHFDAATGVMVTRLVDNAVTMTPATFRTVGDAPARAGAVLRRLHRSDAQFVSGLSCSR